MRGAAVRFDSAKVAIPWLQRPKQVLVEGEAFTEHPEEAEDHQDETPKSEQEGISYDLLGRLFDFANHSSISVQVDQFNLHLNAHVILSQYLWTLGNRSYTRYITKPL